MKKQYWMIFFAFLFLFGILTHRYPLGWNDSSRMGTIEALVHEGTFAIDNTHYNNTGDKYLYEGHYYSDKPPILQIYSSFFYLILKSIGITFEDHPHMTYSIITFLTIGVISALGLVYFYKSLKKLKTDDRWAAILTLIGGSGTLVLTYSTIYNNHVVSGALLMIGFYHLLNIKHGLRHTIFAGLFLSLAGSIEITLFVFLPFALVIFWKKWKYFSVFCLSTIPVILIYLLLNLLTSGSIYPPSVNAELWDYPGSVFDKDRLSGLASHSDGIETSTYAFHMLIGNRGLFSFTPILMFSLWALILIFRKKNVFKPYYLFITLSIVSLILFYIFRTNEYGGGAYGIRWFAPIMLLGLLPIVEVTKRIDKSRSLRILFISLSCFSIMISLIGTVNPYIGTNTHPNSVINCLNFLWMRGPLHLLRILLVASGISYVFYRLWKISSDVQYSKK